MNTPSKTPETDAVESEMPSPPHTIDVQKLSKLSRKLELQRNELLEELKKQERWISNLIGDCVSKRPLNAERMEPNLRLNRDSIRSAIASVEGGEG